MQDSKAIKPPMIRRGQRRPYVKGTLAQLDERRGFVARMLDSGATKTEIHAAVRERFNIEWRQTDRYIAVVAGADTRLARARVEPCQSPRDEYLLKLAKMYEDALKTMIPACLSTIVVHGIICGFT
jgi:hypothetical protein